ncbi:MAG TPA: hypothetical protein P5026_08995 [Kiritimatiellia bacterium]|nr:hypothetical protein [Kiritimatiellia bacterium]HRU70005.1 hypothetical protein [Kiritimatiellia bacterium]
MFLQRHSDGILRWAAQGVRIAVAFCLFALTVLQGLTFCLCTPDADGDGGHCHDCGTPPTPSTTHLEHLCEHLALAGPPPGEPVPAAVKELSDLLLALAALPSCACVPVAPGDAIACHIERPPGVLAPQFLFLARSAQILC